MNDRIFSFTVHLSTKSEHDYAERELLHLQLHNIKTVYVIKYIFYRFCCGGVVVDGAAMPGEVFPELSD